MLRKCRLSSVKYFTDIGKPVRKGFYMRRDFGPGITQSERKRDRKLTL